MTDFRKNRIDLSTTDYELKAALEEKFREETKSLTEKMTEVFSFEENMMICFVPLIISHLAWVYAKRVQQYCAENRLDEFKKPSRELKQLREHYLKEMSKDLDNAHIEKIFKETDRFVEEINYDLTIFYFSVNGEIKKRYPNITHDEMRTNAYISVAMIQMLKAHNKRMDALIAEKLNVDEPAITPNEMLKLASLMTLYSDNIVLDNAENLKRCSAIFMKNIKKIQFDLIAEA